MNPFITSPPIRLALKMAMQKMYGGDYTKWKENFSYLVTNNQICYQNNETKENVIISQIKTNNEEKRYSLCGNKTTYILSYKEVFFYAYHSSKKNKEDLLSALSYLPVLKELVEKDRIRKNLSRFPIK